MQSSLADLLEAWHDFDLLIGTAAATLVGLMFVAASIGASVFLEKDRAAMKAFISPTVVHFSAVLVVAIVSLIRSHDWPALAGLLALVGIPGAAYSANLWLQVFVRRRFNIDIVDRLFYALIPVLGYLLLLLAALVLFRPRSARRRADHASPRRHPQRLGHDAVDRDPRADAERRRPRGNVANSAHP
jgi:predicted ferric reductase